MTRSDQHELLNRWFECIEEHYQEDSGYMPPIKKNMGGPEIIRTEVKHALLKLIPGR